VNAAETIFRRTDAFIHALFLRHIRKTEDGAASQLGSQSVTFFLLDIENRGVSSRCDNSPYHCRSKTGSASRDQCRMVPDLHHTLLYSLWFLPAGRRCSKNGCFKTIAASFPDLKKIR
jgi:hypothetical protein